MNVENKNHLLIKNSKGNDKITMLTLKKSAHLN